MESRSVTKTTNYSFKKQPLEYYIAEEAPSYGHKRSEEKKLFFH